MITEYSNNIKVFEINVRFKWRSRLIIDNRVKLAWMKWKQLTGVL